jgi:hypothetical protein
MSEIGSRYPKEPRGQSLADLGEPMGHPKGFVRSAYVQPPRHSTEHQQRETEQAEGKPRVSLCLLRVTPRVNS